MGILKQKQAQSCELFVEEKKEISKTTFVGRVLKPKFVPGDLAWDKVMVKQVIVNKVVCEVESSRSQECGYNLSCHYFAKEDNVTKYYDTSLLTKDEMIAYLKERCQKDIEKVNESQ